jgi:hypothetical protein
MQGPRITVSAADVWADRHAGWNACIEVWCMPLEQLALDQRPAALVWRYSGEINNGGHLQYFHNLDDQIAAVVSETVIALHSLGRDDYAAVLAEAYRRWESAARLRPADVMEYSVVAQELEFDDLDNAFYKLNIKPKGRDDSWDLLERHYHEYPDRYVVIVPPVTANDLMLLSLGDPSTQPDGGLAVWRSLAENENPRVRLRAARELYKLDPDTSIRTFKALDQDESVPLLVRSHASSNLFGIEMEDKRRRSSTTEDDDQ